MVVRIASLSLSFSLSLSPQTMDLANAGESPLLSRSGGEKGLRGSGAGTLGVPLEGTRRVGAGKSGLHARGEGERVLALESREGTRASRRVEGLSRSFSGGGGKPSCPSPSAGDLRELPRVPDVQVGFRKGRGTRDQIANICWIIEKAREFQKNIYFCFIDEALVPSRDSRARTRPPSPRAWRPDFPGAAREAP